MLYKIITYLNNPLKLRIFFQNWQQKNKRFKKTACPY